MPVTDDDEELLDLLVTDEELLDLLVTDEELMDSDKGPLLISTMQEASHASMLI